MLKDIIRLRRLGFSWRRAFDVSGGHKLVGIGLNSLLGLLAVLALLLTYSAMLEAETQELEARAERETQQAQNVKKVLADVLNGQPLRDSETGHVYFVAVSEQRGL